MIIAIFLPVTPKWAQFICQVMKCLFWPTSNFADCISQPIHDAIQGQETMFEDQKKLMRRIPLLVALSVIVLGAVSPLYMASWDSSCSTFTQATAQMTTSPLSGKPLTPITPTQTSLSGDWRFNTNPDGQGQRQGWQNAEFDDSGWQTLTVPHSWNVMADYSSYEGCAWYRKTFTLPDGI